MTDKDERKDCASCVYSEISSAGYVHCISGRHRDPDIVDCCIPEAPLRKRQHEATDVEMFIAVTHSYITACKKKSIYWRTQQLS
jgi:hypothetical protein